MGPSPLILIILILHLPEAGHSEAAGKGEAPDHCRTCHLNQAEESLRRPVMDWDESLHREKGIGCVDCHGGSPDRADPSAKEKRYGYIGKPDRRDIPRLCGKCHSDPAYMVKFNPSMPIDQEEKYYTSVHGRMLSQGDTNVATCTDCHTSHLIFHPEDPRSSVHPSSIPDTCGACHSDGELMGRYIKPHYDRMGNLIIAGNEVAEYRESVHGYYLIEKGDTSSPVCNDCHGNHGAVPPGITDISHVCGNCHSKQALLFDESPHREAYARAGFPQCESCHGNHLIQKASDHMLGVGEGGVCITCHREAEGDRGYRTAIRMKALLEEMKEEYSSSMAAIQGVEQKGMEVSDALFVLKEAEDSIKEFRSAIHSFRIEKVEGIYKTGMKKIGEVRKEANLASMEHGFRKFWLLITIFLSAVLAVSLYLKIRTLERS